MGMKVKLLPSVFKFPSCTQKPETSSFRIITTSKNDDIFKTINSVYCYLDSDSDEVPDSWFNHSSESGSLSITSDHYEESSTSISGDSHLEEIVRVAQQSSSANHRLFFEPSWEDSPRLGPSKDTVRSGLDVHNLTLTMKETSFKESVAMSLESEDPYEDFKGSMEEMVESYGVKDDWEGLEELLSWYLKVNGKENHGHIISAFVDLLASINDVTSDDDNVNEDEEIPRSSTSFASATSSLSSCLSTSDHMVPC